MNYVDPSSFAENAGKVYLSEKKFKQLRDEILKLSFTKKIYYNKQFKRINEYMVNGDTQPAIVYSVNPLIISVYSDEMDAVVFLKFPSEIADIYSLYNGQRLVSSNIYFEGSKIADDITVGENYLNRYKNFVPVIQLFLSDNEEYTMKRTELFDENIWKRVENLTEDNSANKNGARDGFYYLTEFNPLFMIF